MLARRTAASLVLVATLAGPALADAKVGYKKGFFIQSEDSAYKLVIQGRVQARFTAEIPASGDGEYAFAIQRARVALKGNVFSKDLTYKFQMDLGKGNVALKDFLVDYSLLGGHFRVRVGQYKKPFSRQQINSSGSLEFVDRAITDKAFGGGRDIGILLHNGFDKSPEFEWALGIFNGSGDKSRFAGDVTVDPATGEGSVDSGKFSNVPKVLQPQLVVRLGYNLNDIAGYKEVDFHKTGFRFAVGASALVDFGVPVDGNAGFLRAELDYALKVSGLSSTGGFYLTNAFGSGGGLELLGFHAQVGYLIGDLVQPAVRYARLMPQEAGGVDTQEIALGVNVYFVKHGLKWQTDATMMQVGSADPDWMVRTQLQAAF